VKAAYSAPQEGPQGTGTFGMKIFAAALSACLFAIAGAHAAPPIHTMNKVKALVIDPPTQCA